jgi:hypothetical protein
VVRTNADHVKIVFLFKGENMFFRFGHSYNI